MIYHTQRDPNGNLRYHLEHTPEDHFSKLSLLPQSQQFADTTATLGVESRGFHFTGNTTENQGHDEAIHSDRSLLYDDREDTESFIFSRIGATSNPSFKDPPPVQRTGPNVSGTDFFPSTAEPAAQGSGGAGPSWWDRITANFRSSTNTQSTNLGVKPNEKFQIGLRSSIQTPVKPDQSRAQIAQKAMSTQFPGTAG